MQITTRVVLDSPVPHGGTFTAPLPSGFTSSTAVELSGHELVSIPGGNEYPAVDVRAGSAILTITNRSGGTIPAGTYTLGVNVRGEAASSVDPTAEPNPEYSFARVNSAVASTVAITQVNSAGTFEQSISYNSDGEVLAISKWTRVV